MSSPRAPAGLCFQRRASASLPLDRLDVRGLSQATAQALADTLPFLLCGEESAVHAFGRRHAAALDRATLAAIAADESRHAAWLEALAAALPPPSAAVQAQRMASFFRGLLTRQPARHFAAIAALDLAVCRLLQPLAGAGSVLRAAPEVHAGLRRIRQDEARHVRIARDCARRLGVDALTQRSTDAQLQTALDELLAPVHAALSHLGIAPPAVPSTNPGPPHA